jgi:malonyl-CoA decarboxylase
MPNWPNLLEDIMTRITDIGSTMITSNENLSINAMCEGLLSNTGEATNLARSLEILKKYKTLNEEEKLSFVQAISRDFAVDENALRESIKQWLNDPSTDRARALHAISEPCTQELFRRLNLAPGGTEALVKLREDLLVLAQKDKILLALDMDIRHLFSSWFNRGFLSLEVINWSTPAEILERIIAYEAVHEIHGWDDLRRRVAANDRRLYAFFHPSLKNDPLIFVEVALTDTTPKTINQILAEDRYAIEPTKATTAVFYSISNCQSGLRGISFGNFLIKQVVEELKREFSNLKHFVTMSPVPGLRRWAKAQDNLNNDLQKLVNDLELQENSPTDVFKDISAPLLTQLTSLYLLHAKHKSGGPYDLVSRFHLGNGDY